MSVYHGTGPKDAGNAYFRSAESKYLHRFHLLRAGKNACSGYGLWRLDGRADRWDYDYTLSPKRATPDRKNESGCIKTLGVHH